MAYNNQEEEDNIGVFLNYLDKAGYINEYISKNPKRLLSCFNGLDFYTVDELIDFLELDGDGDFETRGRKYVLGYFGGSGSTKLKFNRGKKKEIRKNEPTRKRDKSGRWIL